jgi:hypothetical protein
VCEVLNTSAGGAAAQSGLESLVTRVSQGRIDPRTFIPTTVWIAGAACKHLLPDAAEAIYQFFTSQRTSGTTSP